MVVWEPQTSRRECDFEYSYATQAITDLHHIAIEDAGIFSRIDRDLRQLNKIKDDCHLNEALLTDDGLLIEFPDHFHRRPEQSGFFQEQTFWIRKKREISGILGAHGERVEFDIGQNFSTPLIWKLYGKRNIKDIYTHRGHSSEYF
uniref:Uncharacterized protein n=1 Tax=Caenorhabditis japonica TaxID=281687 RepID=A0A8R1E1E7_CAEJA